MYHISLNTGLFRDSFDVVFQACGVVSPHPFSTNDCSNRVDSKITFRSGALLILCRAQSRAEVEKIIGEDPFNAVADYRVIEFEPNKSVEGFKELLKIG